MKNGPLISEARRHLEKLDDQLHVSHLYDSMKGQVISWILRNYGLNRNDAREIYQEAFIIFYYQGKKGLLNSLNCTVVTYLTGIVKNLVKQKRGKYVMVTIGDNEDVYITESELESRINHAYNELLVNKLMARMQNPCYTILDLFYRKRYSLEAIANKLKYKNANVVKKKKSLCLKELRGLYHKSRMKNE